MKMSGMLTRSSMACSFRPSRCRSKASPRMACRGGPVRRGLRDHRALLPSAEACGSNTSSVHWPLTPLRPEQPDRKALTSEMGKLRRRGLPGRQDLRAQAWSWVA